MANPKTMITISSLVLLMVFSQITAKKKEPVRSLCDDPYITAADRLPNDTIRVYRGEYYWELPGVGDRKVKPLGPYPVWFKYMSPISKTASMMTVVSGPMEGTVWKFDRNKYWQWQSNGRQVIGTKAGSEWSEMPSGGFDCVLNDGDLEGKGYPMMIAFKGVRVYYWKTYMSTFEKIGDVYNGYKNGQFGEEFPSDLTACTAVRLSKKGAKYYVLLFKKKEYCLRPVKGEQGCSEWRSNKELFGCPGAGSGSSNEAPQPNQPSGGNDKNARPPPPPEPNRGDDDTEAADDPSDKKGANRSAGKAVQNVLLLLLVIASNLMKHF